MLLLVVLLSLNQNIRFPKFTREILLLLFYLYDVYFDSENAFTYFSGVC